MGEPEDIHKLADRLARIRSKLAYLTSDTDDIHPTTKYSSGGFEETFDAGTYGKEQGTGNVGNLGNEGPELKEAREAVETARTFLDRCMAQGIDNINVHTSRIELSAALDALKSSDPEQAVQLATRIRTRMERLLEKVRHETTAHALSSAYSLLASARVYEIPVVKETRKLDTASRLFMEDHYDEANSIINEVTAAVRTRRDRDLKERIDGIFVETELLGEMLRNMGLDPQRLQELQGMARSLYTRKNFPDALSRAAEAHQLALTLKESFIGKYLSELFEKLGRDIARARELGIDTMEFEQLEARLHTLSHKKDVIEEMTDIENRYKQALIDLELKVERYRDINLSTDMEELEELIFFANDLGVNLSDINPKFEAIHVAFDHKDLESFRKLKLEIISDVRPKLDARYEELSREAFVQVQRTRSLLSRLEHDGVDTREARKVFARAKGYLVEGKYKRIIDICIKTQEIVESSVETNRENSEPGHHPGELEAVLESYDLQLRRLNTNDIDIKASLASMETARLALKNGDEGMVWEQLRLIDKELAQIPNNVWIAHLIRQLREMVSEKDRRSGDTHFLNEMYDRALDHMRKENYFEAMKAIMDGQITTMRK